MLLQGDGKKRHMFHLQGINFIFAGGGGTGRGIGTKKKC